MRILLVSVLFSCAVQLFASKISILKRDAIPVGIDKTVVPDELKSYEVDAIKAYQWSLEDGRDTRLAQKCIRNCHLLNKFEAAAAVIDIGVSLSGFLFAFTVSEATTYNQIEALEYLLQRFDEKVSVKIFEKASHLSKPTILQFWIRQGLYRFTGSLDSIIGEIIKACFNYSDCSVLAQFLRSCPHLTCSVITSFEDAIISGRNKHACAFLVSGILGPGNWDRFSVPHIKKRRICREEVKAMVSAGNASTILSFLKEIELPFLIDFTKSSLFSSGPNGAAMFKILLGCVAKSLLTSEAREIFITACTRGNKENREICFKVLTDLGFDLPLLILSLQKGTARIDPLEIVKHAIDLGYKPKDGEVVSCVHLYLSHNSIPAALMDSYPDHFNLEDLRLIVRLLTSACYYPTTIATLKLFRDAHRFLQTRWAALRILMQFPKFPFHQQEQFQCHPDILKLIFQAIDPRFFLQPEVISLEVATSGNMNEGEAFISEALNIFLGRLQRSSEYWATISLHIRLGLRVPLIWINAFIQSGGSWDEILCASSAHPVHARLVKTSLANNADPFIVDRSSGLPLLRNPKITREAWNDIYHAQNVHLSNNEMLRLLMMAAFFDNGSVFDRMIDIVKNIVEIFRTFEIEDRRRQSLLD